MEKFIPEMIKKPNVGQQKFVRNLMRKPLIYKVNNIGGDRRLSFETPPNDGNIEKWKRTDLYHVFIYRVKEHEKHRVNDEKRYFNHYFFYFYLVPMGKWIDEIAAKHEYDFGLHRIEDSVRSTGSEILMVIKDEDLDGRIA